MKIVRRKEFLTLPKVTVYSTVYSLNISSEICIKLETVGTNDWYYETVGGFTNWSASHELYTRIEEMIDKKTEYRASDGSSISRDGLFDDEEEKQFAIYDKQDVKDLVDLLQLVLSKL